MPWEPLSLHFHWWKCSQHGEDDEDDDGAGLDREASDGLFPEPTLPPKWYAPEWNVREEAGSVGSAQAGGRECALRNLKFHTAKMSTEETEIQERSKMRDQLEKGGGGRAGRKIHPPPPHPSLQVFLSCRCRWAALSALVNIHLLWVVIPIKSQTAIYPLFLSLSRVRGYL